MGRWTPRFSAVAITRHIPRIDAATYFGTSYSSAVSLTPFDGWNINVSSCLRDDPLKVQKCQHFESSHDPSLASAPVTTYCRCTTSTFEMAIRQCGPRFFTL